MIHTIRNGWLAALLGALSAGPALAADPLTVYAVNYPLAYFAERIGGEQVEVVFPAPADVDPAYWAPAPEVIADYQKADLILLNGADYAHWVGRTTLPASKMVNTSASLAATATASTPSLPSSATAPATATAVAQRPRHRQRVRQLKNHLQSAL